MENRGADTPFFRLDTAPWRERSTYSGCDIIPVCVGRDREGKDQIFVIGDIATLSYSIHQDKGAVRTLGRNRVRGFTRGCIASDELIYTDKGYKKVKDIFIGDKILSLDEKNNQVSYQKCTNKFYKGSQECYSVLLQDSSKMDLTKTHLVYTKEGWKTVSELIVNDELMIPLDYGVNDDINIPDYYIKFMAYSIGDGVFGLYKNGKEKRFSFTPGVYDAKIVKDIEDECLKNNLSYHKRFDRNCYNITIHNCEKSTGWAQRIYKPFIIWTRSLGIYGKKSYEKTVPDLLMNMSISQTQLFLNRIWGTDGTIHVRKKKINDSVRISYSTTSHKLAIQIKQLLSKVGIYSYIGFNPVNEEQNRKNKWGIIRKHDSYNVIIPAEYHYRFLTEIGIFGKEERYENILESLKNNLGYKYQDLRDYIEHNKLNIRKKFGAGISTLNSKTITYEMLKKLGEHIFDFLRKYKPSCYEKFKWVKIKEIKKIGVFKTYDLEIDNNHNLFGMFLSHNSITIAGSMIFNVFNQRALWDISKSKSDVTKKVVIAHQLPSFDIILNYVNEFGLESTMAIYGIQVADEGQTHSIEDVYTENTMSYVAMDIDLMERKGSEGGIPTGAIFTGSRREQTVAGLNGNTPFNYQYLVNQ